MVSFHHLVICFCNGDTIHGIYFDITLMGFHNVCVTDSRPRPTIDEPKPKASETCGGNFSIS